MPVSRFIVEIPRSFSREQMHDILWNTRDADGFNLTLLDESTQIQLLHRGEVEILAIENGRKEIRHGSFDHPCVRVVETIKDGKALLAYDNIPAGTIVAVFDGKISETTEPSCRSLSNGRYVIQIGERSWRDSDGIARYANHSCKPNCGIVGLDTLVAMRNIRRLEEITWAYWMTEDPGKKDLRIKCTCNEDNCIEWITGFSDIPTAYKTHYAPYLSDWIRARHNITTPRPRSIVRP